MGQPAYADIEWVQGQTNEEQITAYHDGVAVDWTEFDYSAVMYIREQPTDTGADLLFSLSSATNEIILAADGLITIRAQPDDTDTVDLGSDRVAYYQLWITNNDADPVEQWVELEGQIKIEGSYAE